MKHLLSKLNIILLACMLCVCLTSCEENTYEEEPIIKVDKKEEEIVYNTDSVTVGPVEKSNSINCQYTQTKEQEVCFTEGGKIIDKVYVREGDRVSKGDILVELKTDNIEEQILDLEYSVKKSQLRLTFIDKNKEFDLDSAHDSLIHSRLTGDDFCNYDEEVKKIERNYKYQKEDLEDSILFDNKRIEELKKQLSAKTIVSTMDGTVISIEKHLEGSVSKRGAVIMTVADSSNGLFETESPELKEIVKQGDIIQMSIVYGDAKGEYELTPYEMDKWDLKQAFSIVSGPDNEGLEIGTKGTIKIIEDSRENVLRIPFSALYETEDGFYTYTVNSDNLREVRFIEVGLIGDNYVEILSGLNEKEKVIKK